MRRAVFRSAGRVPVAFSCLGLLKQYLATKHYTIKCEIVQFEYFLKEAR